MKCPLILLFTTVLFSTSAFADRNLILIGGGGEATEKTGTMFDDTLKDVDSYLQKNKWNNYSVSFNGGHPETEAILASRYSNAQSKNTFNEDNYKALLKSYQDKITNGQIKAGDQLMVMIDTHGAARLDEGSEVSHAIAIGSSTGQANLNDLSGTTTTSLDTMKALIDLAKSKGVKLAILDFSCHSGNTLALANSNTCVISSTGPQHFGYENFSKNFIAKMKSGKSLEDVFLDARKSTADTSFPMISTTAGVAINKDIYPDITPYLYYYDKDPRSDKMTSYIQTSGSNVGLCARQNQYADLLGKLDQLQSVGNAGMKNLPEIKKIKGLIADYKASQDRYINMLRSWGSTELNRREQIVGVGTSGRKSEQMTGNFTWGEMINTDYDQIIRNVTVAKNGARDAATQAMFAASIDMHTKARNRQQEIFAQYPQLKGYKQKLQEQLKEMDGTYNLAYQIALEERKLYDSMYSNLRQNNTQANPCKDFVL
jgi:soluble cytochrome b562